MSLGPFDWQTLVKWKLFRIIIEDGGQGMSQRAYFQQCFIEYDGDIPMLIYGEAKMRIQNTTEDTFIEQEFVRFVKSYITARSNAIDALPASAPGEFGEPSIRETFIDQLTKSRQLVEKSLMTILTIAFNKSLKIYPTTYDIDQVRYYEVVDNVRYVPTIRPAKYTFTDRKL